jgi:hypothetical protein
MSHKAVSAEDRQSALESDYAALYAVAGLTDALADALRGALVETQHKASNRISELQSKRPDLTRHAKASAEDLRTFVITLPEQFKHLPDTTKARIAELQKQANDLVAHASSSYGDFAGRGKQAVEEARRSARSGASATPITPQSAADATQTGEAGSIRTGAKHTRAKETDTQKMS